MKDAVFSKELLERVITSDAALIEAKEKGELHQISQEGVALYFSLYEGHIYALDIIRLRHCGGPTV